MYMGTRLGACARKLAPLCGAIFNKKKRGHGVKKNTRKAPQQTPQFNHSLVWGVPERGGGRGHHSLMGISWMEHAQEPPARKMFYNFHVQAFYPSSLRSGDGQRLGRQAMFASRSGARFPRRGQRIEARIVSVFMLTCVHVPSLRALPRELQKGALLLNRGPVCRPRVLSDHPLGRPGKSMKKAKRLSTCRFF